MRPRGQRATISRRRSRLAEVKGRRAQVHDQLRAFLDQPAHQIAVVEGRWQVILRPDVLADRHADLAAGDREDLPAPPGSK